LAERERFELSLELSPYYRFSKPAPSATWVPLQVVRETKIRICEILFLRLINWRNLSGSQPHSVVWELGFSRLVRIPPDIWFLNLAEGVGFEPTDPCGSPVFKTGALGRYATPPCVRHPLGTPESIALGVSFFKLGLIVFRLPLMHNGLRNDTYGGVVDEPEVAQEQYEDQEGPAEELQSFSWQASEFLHHTKNPLWYSAFIGGVVIAVGICIYLQQWFSIPVFVMMGFAVMTYANKTPRILQYTLDEHGITIGDKHYSYNQFRDFAVISDVGWHSIDLDPVKRFAQRISVIFEDKDFEDVVGILEQFLPRVDRAPDPIDRFSRKIRF
jgi:hypothetical protein